VLEFSSHVRMQVKDGSLRLSAQVAPGGFVVTVGGGITKGRAYYLRIMRGAMDASKTEELLQQLAEIEISGQ
jgi:hypothetical protein